MPFLPFGDDTERRRIDLPGVTWGLMAACFFVFIYQQGIPVAAEAEFVYGYGFIPAVLGSEAALTPELERLPGWLTLFTYQFLHGNWDHLLGNLLFLWIFGDNVEDALGHLRFLIFYVLCGVIAALAHFAAGPGSLAPLIGASGAISGVLGAYLLLHPFARIVVLLVVVPLKLPAWVLLLVWFGFQFVALGQSDGPVAWMAHIGGFIAGAVLVIPFRRRGVRLLARREVLPLLVLGRRRRPRAAPSGGQARGRRREAKPPSSGPRE